jgi:hypothetical protein
MNPKEVFLSHSSKNRADAAMLAETLRNHGVPVWYSSTNIRNAQQWIDEIGNALKRCDWFVVLLTKASVSAKWVKWELSYALTHSQYDNQILPVKAGNCKYEDLSWTLGAIQMVKFRGGHNQAFRDILATWGIGFDPKKKAKKALKGARRKRRAP